MARVSWALLTPPAQEPITVAEAKQHARITASTDDVTIQRFVASAREACEEHLGRGLFTQTWQLALDRFYDVMSLPRACPLQNDPAAVPSTALIVQYYDGAGTLQTLATTVYAVDTISRPACLVLAPGQTWPAVQSTRLSGRVLITYVIGWTDLSLIPERFKQGMRMYVSCMDADREGLEDYHEKALAAAEACWADRVTWIEPNDCAIRYGSRY